MKSQWNVTPPVPLGGMRRGRVRSIAAGCGWCEEERNRRRLRRRELPKYRLDSMPPVTVGGESQGPTGGNLLAKTTFIQR